MLNLNADHVEHIIGEAAEKVVLKYYNAWRDAPAALGDIRLKGPDDPVTIADIETEKQLSKDLTAILPGSLVVGEEAYSTNPGLMRALDSDTPVWIIDPIDGTKCFIERQPYFGIIVALAYKNETLRGWLYDPNAREFIAAEKGSGAWHKGNRLTVAQPDALEKMHGVFNNLFTAEIRANLPMDVGGPIFHTAHSSCHDHARLVVQQPHFSRQTSPIHFHGIKCHCTPWDIAAGELIHREAGGYTAHWNGDAFKPSHMDRGFMSAPDKDSWQRLYNWLKTHPRCAL